MPIAPYPARSVFYSQPSAAENLQASINFDDALLPACRAGGSLGARALGRRPWKESCPALSGGNLMARGDVPRRSRLCAPAGASSSQREQCSNRKIYLWVCLSLNGWTLLLVRRAKLNVAALLAAAWRGFRRIKPASTGLRDAAGAHNLAAVDSGTPCRPRSRKLAPCRLVMTKI